MRRIMQLVLWRESTRKRETASRPGRQLQLPKQEAVRLEEKKARWRRGLRHLWLARHGAVVLPPTYIWSRR